MEGASGWGGNCKWISRYEYLGELNLSLLRLLSSDDLLVILYWVFGFLPFYKLPSQKTGDAAKRTEASSQTRKEALMADLFRKQTGCHSGELKSFSLFLWVASSFDGFHPTYVCFSFVASDFYPTATNSSVCGVVVNWMLVGKVFTIQDEHIKLLCLIRRVTRVEISITRRSSSDH